MQHKLYIQDRWNSIYPRNMICFRHIIVNTLHKGNNNNNNNNNSGVSHIFIIPSHTQNINIPLQHAIMAPHTGSIPRSSFPGLWKYPTYRKEPIKYAELWMEGKKVDDNTGGLWRVHDALYDFTDWIYKHPGGSDWLNLTKVGPIIPCIVQH